MLLRIYFSTGKYRIHAAQWCYGQCGHNTPPGDEVTEIGQAEQFASQRAAWLHIWSSVIADRQRDAAELDAADEHDRASAVRDVSDLWLLTIFEPCCFTLPHELADHVTQVTHTMT
jgi:hypothetical protein